MMSLPESPASCGVELGVELGVGVEVDLARRSPKQVVEPRDASAIAARRGAVDAPLGGQTRGGALEHAAQLDRVHHVGEGEGAHHETAAPCPSSSPSSASRAIASRTGVREIASASRGRPRRARAGRQLAAQDLLRSSISARVAWVLAATGSIVVLLVPAEVYIRWRRRPVCPGTLVPVGRGCIRGRFAVPSADAGLTAPGRKSENGGARHGSAVTGGLPHAFRIRVYGLGSRRRAARACPARRGRRGSRGDRGPGAGDRRRLYMASRAEVQSTPPASRSASACPAIPEPARTSSRAEVSDDDGTPRHDHA